MTFASPDISPLLKEHPKDRDLPCPHVLKADASAGSGKTFLLACRFVQFLLSRRIPRSAPGNLVAITFTNEAAREMEDRVLRFLKEAALGVEETLDTLSRYLDMDREGIKRAALEAVEYLLGDLDALQIRTIDSFIHRLVLAAPQELGLGAQEEIEPNPWPLQAEAFDRLVFASSGNRAVYRVLKNALDHSLVVRGRNSWWPLAGMLQDLKRLFDVEGTHGESFSTGRPHGSTLALARLIEKKLRSFLDLVGKEGLSLKQKAEAAFMEVLEGGNVAASLKKAWWAKPGVDGLFLKSGRAPSPRLQDAWDELRALASRYAMTRALESTGAYLELYGLWKEELQRLKSRRRTLFFQDINMLSLVLQDELTMPEVFFRLGERLFHFMIDEFQDTSLLQWKNLLPLLENGLAQGGSFFCVGDAKQMLYRWRGSDPYLFHRAPLEVGRLEPESRLSLVLPYNRRSHPAVTEFVSLLFGQERLRHLLEEAEKGLGAGEIQDIVRVYAHARQEIPPGTDHPVPGYVQVELVDDARGMDAARQAAWNRVVELLQGEILPRRDPGEVMVLARDNREVEEISLVLCANRIPVFSHRQLDIRQDVLVQELLSFLRFLQDPQDVDALCVFLTGRIVEEPWLAHGPTGISPLEWLEEKLASRDQGPKRRLLAALEEEAPGLFRLCFQGPLSCAGYLTPYDLACRFIRAMDLYARFPSHDSALDHLLELLNEGGPLGGIQWGDLQELHMVPDEVFMARGTYPRGAVRVMTIHKSKGLEANVAVFPMATLLPRPGSLVVREAGGGLELVDISGGLHGLSRELDRYWRREKALSWVDELNVLYVALTRAREELYVLLPGRIGKRTNHLWSMVKDLGWKEARFTMGTRDGLGACREGKGPERPRAKGPGPEREGFGGARPWDEWRWPSHLVRVKRDVTEFLPGARSDAIAAGEAVHRLMALLDAPLGVPPEIGKVEGFLVEAAREVGGDPLDMDLPAIARMMCHAVMIPFFWPEDGAIVWRERELVDARGELHRLDRAVLGKTSIVVAEFKTGEERYALDLAQLGRYQEILSGIYPDREIKGVLVYLRRRRIVQPGGKAWSF